MSVSSEVLLIQQDGQDEALFQKATADTRFAGLRVMENAGEALDYLHQRGEYTAAARPGLVVIDTSRPELRGFDVLEEVMSDRALRSIPVIVLVDGEQGCVPSFPGGQWTIAQRPLSWQQVSRLFESYSRDVEDEEPFAYPSASWMCEEMSWRLYTTV